MQIGGESFQNRSQTKSKALFIILFLIIGIFLIFKLTQDGSRYANPFGTQSKEEVRLPQKTKNTTSEASDLDKKRDENTGFLKNLVDKVNTFNETMKKLDEMLKNVNLTEVFQKLNQSSSESESETNFMDILDLGNYDTQKDELLKNLNQLKEAFEKATNGTKRDLEDVL